MGRIADARGDASVDDKQRHGSHDFIKLVLVILTPREGSQKPHDPADRTRRAECRVSRLSERCVIARDGSEHIGSDIGHWPDALGQFERASETDLRVHSRNQLSSQVAPWI